VIKDPRRATVLRDTQTRLDVANHRRQYVPQFKGQNDGAYTSEAIRLIKDKKKYIISSCDAFWKRNEKTTQVAPNDIHRAAFDGENMFTALTEAWKVYTLDQLSHTHYEVGGQFRLNR
jgi:hypothetical protein